MQGIFSSGKILGAGVDLTEANLLIMPHYDHSCELVKQVRGRVSRTGQTRKVTSRRYLDSGIALERIMGDKNRIMDEFDKLATRNVDDE